MKRSLYDEDHESFRASIREFIAKEVTPNFGKWEEVGHPPRDLFRKLGELGAMGFGIPEEYGGPGEVSYRYQAVLNEEAAYAGVALGHYGVTTSIVLPYLLHLANEEQKDRWLPGIATGDIVLCIAMTEPGTGSDLAGIRTTASSEDGTHYVLNGAKTFITGASQAELVIVVARTSPPATENRRAGLSLLVVATDSPGFELGRKLDKIGMQTSDTDELSFTDVRVPVGNLLGEEGQAFAYLARNLAAERLAIGVEARCRGAPAAINFATVRQQRTVYGKPVASFQNTKFVLAECDTEVTARGRWSTGPSSSRTPGS